MATNLQAVRQRAPGIGTLQPYEEIGRLLTGNIQATADDGVKWVSELVRLLQIPGLRTYSLRENDVGEVVSKATNASSMKANPIVLTTEELAETLRAAM
jgi:alcohol dehydrogenase class IV